MSRPWNFLYSAFGAAQNWWFLCLVLKKGLIHFGVFLRSGPLITTFILAKNHHTTLQQPSKKIQSKAPYLPCFLAHDFVSKDNNMQPVSDTVFSVSDFQDRKLNLFSALAAAWRWEDVNSLDRMKLIWGSWWSQDGVADKRQQTQCVVGRFMGI